MRNAGIERNWMILPHSTNLPVEYLIHFYRIPQSSVIISLSLSKLPNNALFSPSFMILLWYFVIHKNVKQDEDKLIKTIRKLFCQKSIKMNRSKSFKNDYNSSMSFWALISDWFYFTISINREIIIWSACFCGTVFRHWCLY